MTLLYTYSKIISYYSCLIGICVTNTVAKGLRVTHYHKGGNNMVAVEAG